MRATSALVLLAILIGMSFFPAATPTACSDGCGEEQDTKCVDCPFCAPLAAPMILPVRHSPTVESASPLAARAVCQPSRIEDQDVFHVPRRLV